MWASNQQDKFITTDDWPTWKEFKDVLDNTFADPGTEYQAREFLLTYRQNKEGARDFFNTLELWFTLANIKEDPEKFQLAKQTMDPTTQESFVLTGFPTTYKDLKEKMLLLKNE